MAGVDADAPRTPTDEPAAFGWAAVAIVLWGTLAAAVGDALDTVRGTTVVLWSFLVAAATLVLAEVVAGRGLSALRAPPRVVLTGLLGIFGYHALFFLALERAPIVQANLLNYLWPLLMVVLAPWIVGERLTGATLLGAGLGFGGAALLVLGEAPPGQAPAAAPALGYALAALAAAAWSVYSLLLKRLGPVAEGRTALFLVVSVPPAALLALLDQGPAGLAPPSGRALVVIAWMGVGPMALAFVAWGRALARGSAARLGALSYTDPLLSTLLVAWHLERPLGPSVWLGMGLIVGGASLPALAARIRTSRLPS